MVVFAHSFGAQLLGGLAEGEGLGLGEDVRHQDVVVIAEGIEALGKANEVNRNDGRPLVDQLIEAVLAIRAGFTPIDGPGLVAHVFATLGHVLAV